MNHGHSLSGPAGPSAHAAAARPAELIALGGGLVLRRRCPEQAEALNAAILANLEHLRPWVPWADPAPSLAETLANSEEAFAGWDAGRGYLYLIQPADDPHRVVGGCGLHGRVGAGALEIGYWVAGERTGAGVATAAARGLTEAALALPGIDRVEIHVDEANKASSAVPRRLGYRWGGCGSASRSRWLSPGGWRSGCWARSRAASARPRAPAAPAAPAGRRCR